MSEKGFLRKRFPDKSSDVRLDGIAVRCMKMVCPGNPLEIGVLAFCIATAVTTNQLLDTVGSQRLL